MNNRYEEAKLKYESFGIDVENAINKARDVAVSIHCWQGDDVVGFENNQSLSGGIGVTGNYPGRARNIEELMQDLDFVFKFIPGKYKVNLHAIYGDFKAGSKREEIKPEDFDKWIEFANQRNIGLDFNPTLFSHEKVQNNLTLSHPNKEIRDYWINYAIKCREIANYIALKTSKPVLNNLWIPDGTKDFPSSRLEFRTNLKDSLDKIYAGLNQSDLVFDSMESKVFGVGIESFTVGSHEFYLQYAKENNLLCLLDNGHFHPTESVADKISSMLLFNEKVALHLTRSVRWDSDHVISLNDEIQDICNEIAKYDAYESVFIGLDFFDASVNRIAAWVIGTRNVKKAILKSLLIPHLQIEEAGNNLDFTKVLMLNEEVKSLPFDVIWEKFCEIENVESSSYWYDEVIKYEKDVLEAR